MSDRVMTPDRALADALAREKKLEVEEERRASQTPFLRDSGRREDFGTGSKRDTSEGKGRFDLIPTYPVRRLARHYEAGAKKYGDRNWEKGQPLMRYLESLERHLNCLKAGDRVEDHCAAIAWNIFGYMNTEENIRAGRLPESLDNRPGPDPECVDGVLALPGGPAPVKK